MMRVNPDLYLWSANNRNRFHMEEANGNTFIQGNGGLTRQELRKIIKDIVMEDGKHGEVL